MKGLIRNGSSTKLREWRLLQLLISRPKNNMLLRMDGGIRSSSNIPSSPLFFKSSPPPPLSVHYSISIDPQSSLLGEAALLAASATTTTYYHISFRLPSPTSKTVHIYMAEQDRRHFRHSSSSSLEVSGDDFRHMSLEPPPWQNRKRLSKQLSMCETHRNIAWEKRRRQILEQERRRNGLRHDYCDNHLTDEDLNELKGSIELGFGFTEEEGQPLTHTLPALDLYFAVNRQISLSSPGSTPQSLGDRSSSFGSTKSDSDSWRICSPGDDPEQVKTKLRHWAQAVACSVMQSSNGRLD